MEAIKNDSEKIRMELLPPFSLEEIAKVFTFGAKKYDSWNYLNGEGLSQSRVYGALQRHLNAWYKGDLIDVETGESHLAHAGCCIMMLIELQEFRNKNDKPSHYNNNYNIKGIVKKEPNDQILGNKLRKLYGSKD